MIAKLRFIGQFEGALHQSLLLEEKVPRRGGCGGKYALFTCPITQQSCVNQSQWRLIQQTLNRDFDENVPFDFSMRRSYDV